jgi:hypothetical protein
MQASILPSLVCGLHLQSLYLEQDLSRRYVSCAFLHNDCASTAAGVCRAQAAGKACEHGHINNTATLHHLQTLASRRPSCWQALSIGHLHRRLRGFMRLSNLRYGLTSVRVSWGGDVILLCAGSSVTASRWGALHYAPDLVDTWCFSPQTPPPTQAINRHTETEMQYKGVVDAVRRMLADEGIAGFYKGEFQCRTAVLLKSEHANVKPASQSLRCVQAEHVP